MDIPTDIVARVAGPGPCLRCETPVDAAWRICAPCSTAIVAERSRAAQEADERSNAEWSTMGLEKARRSIPAGLRLSRLEADVQPEALRSIRHRGANAPSWAMLGGPFSALGGIAIFSKWMMPWSLYVTAPELARELFEHPIGEGPPKLSRWAKRAPVLMLDELGAEQVRNGAVTEVLRSRLASDRPTIVATTRRFGDLEETYGDIARRVYERAGGVVMCRKRNQETPS